MVPSPAVSSPHLSSCTTLPSGTHSHIFPLVIINMYANVSVENRYAVCAFHLQGPNHVWQASSQTRGWLFQPNNEEEIIQEIVTKQAITLMHAGFSHKNQTFCFNYLRDMSA